MVNPYRFYTYAYLREDRTPYYIGKGQTHRAYQQKGKPCATPKDKNRIIFLKQNLTEEEAFKHEIYMIAVLGRKDLGTGILHNRTNGGDGVSGWVPSEETKRKISKIHKGKIPWNKGVSHTRETKNKISKAKRGKPSPHKGKKLFSDDAKEKMSKARKGQFSGDKNPRAKTWKIIFNDGRCEVIKSLQTWAIQNGYNPNSIRNLYNGSGLKVYKNIVSVQELAQDT